MSVKIAGNTGTIAEVNSANQIKVVTEVNTTTNKANVGAVKFISENDEGDLTGVKYLKAPETSSDYRLRVGVDSILFEDSFNATTQNTNIWSYVFATLTAAQPGAGTVNFSAVQGTTSAHGAHMRTFQYFPLVNTAPLAIEFLLGMFTAPLVSGEVFRFGIGLPGSAIAPPTDGVCLQITSGGVEGIIIFNGTEVSTGVILPYGSLVTGNMDKFAIVIGEREIEYWMDDMLLAEQDIPVANGVPWLGVSAPIFMQKYNTGAVSNTNTVRVSRVGATLLDLNSSRSWGNALATIGRTAYVGQNGHTMGLTAGNYGGTAAIPGTQAGSNTAPNASMAGLGGVFQMTAQASAAGASGDMVASYYLNPASTINITGRNLVITSVQISAINYGAVVATTPTTLLWGLAYGHTNVSLATNETGSFATATTHSPRKRPLGFMYAPIGAVIGQPYDRLLDNDMTVSPIVIRPGEYLATTVRFVVGTATSSQTVLYTVNFNGYFE